jgi:hypothetical protein
MKIKSILNEVNNSNAALLLENEWNDLTFKQKDQINLIEKELKPLFDSLSKELLIERDLTVDEIGAIFDNAVIKANELGGNRTAVGKIKDITVLPLKTAQALDNKINELGKTIQNSEPVVNFDAKFEKLKVDITEKNGNKKVVQMLQFLSDKAKKHPTATVFIIGIITAAGAILAGPAGGAAAGFIMNAVGKLLQGEKLSTAVGTSAKTAIYGYLAGLTFKWISSEVLENIALSGHNDIDVAEKAFLQAQEEAVKSSAIASNPDLASVLKADNITNLTYSGNINNFHFNYDLMVTPENSEKVSAIFELMKSQESFSKGYYESASKLHELLSGIQQSPQQESYRAAWDILEKMKEAGKTLSYENLSKVVDMGDSLYDKMAALGKASKFIGGIIQASIQQSSIAKKSMHDVSKAEHVEETGPRNESLNTDEEVLEESNFFSAAVEKIKKAGENVSNIITRDNLIKAWKKAGKPVDSVKIKELLSQYFTKQISHDLVVVIDSTITGSGEDNDVITSQSNQQLDKLVNAIILHTDADELIKYAQSLT